MATTHSSVGIRMGMVCMQQDILASKEFAVLHCAARTMHLRHQSRRRRLQGERGS